MAKKEAVFTKDVENRKLTVVRSFDAPVAQVWKAWTTGEILDEWWAPKPYKAETKTMDFRPGGYWMYSMVGPQGDKSWNKVSFTAVEPHKSFSNAVVFCDEAGNENPGFPKMYWKNDFSQEGDGTTVTVEITFDKTADMEMIVKMGFQEGFAMGLGNLDDYLSSH